MRFPLRQAIPTLATLCVLLLCNRAGFARHSGFPSPGIGA